MLFSMKEIRKKLLPRVVDVYAIARITIKYRIIIMYMYDIYIIYLDLLFNYENYLLLVISDQV